MLDDFSIIVESKNVDPCIFSVLWPLLITLKYHKVTLGNSRFEINSLSGIPALHSLKIFDGRRLPISHLRIVLYAYVTNTLFDCVT